MITYLVMTLSGLVILTSIANGVRMARKPADIPTCMHGVPAPCGLGCTF